MLTLSNPGARNALHPDMYAAGIEALDSAERDNPSIRAVVLTGADNFFCAGGNLNRLLENRAKDPSVQAREHRSARPNGSPRCGCRPSR